MVDQRHFARGAGGSHLAGYVIVLGRRNENPRRVVVAYHYALGVRHYCHLHHLLYVGDNRRAAPFSYFLKTDHMIGVVEKYHPHLLMRQVADAMPHKIEDIGRAFDLRPLPYLLVAVSAHNLHHSLYLEGLGLSDTLEHLELFVRLALEIEQQAVVHPHHVAAELGHGISRRAHAQYYGEKIGRR